MYHYYQNLPRCECHSCTQIRAGNGQAAYGQMQFGLQGYQAGTAQGTAAGATAAQQNTQ